MKNSRILSILLIVLCFSFPSLLVWLKPFTRGYFTFTTLEGNEQLFIRPPKGCESEDTIIFQLFMGVENLFGQACKYNNLTDTAFVSETGTVFYIEPKTGYLYIKAVKSN